MSNEVALPIKQNGSIDWITATTTSDKVGSEWFRLFELLQIAHDRGSSLPALWERKAIRGYEGVQGEYVFWGKSVSQGYILTVWGEGCESAWAFMAPTARRISRVDLAVTVELEEPVPRLAHSTYLQNAKETRPKYTYWENSDGGSTLYVGSRQSSMYGRLYDKGVMWGEEPGKVWRYELELKDKLNNLAMLKTMLERFRSHGVFEDDILGYVHQWFSLRGVSPRFFAENRGLPRVETGVTLNTADKKLKWLNEQVAPTVQKLIEVGLGDQALLALGLERDQLPMWDDTTLEGKAKVNGV